MGSDAFNGFQQWKQPQRILELAHLIVCARPGVELSAPIYAQHWLNEGESLNDHPCGKISFFSMNPNPCAASDIREKLTQGLAVDQCLSQPVLDFIRQQQLYEN